MELVVTTEQGKVKGSAETGAVGSSGSPTRLRRSAKAGSGRRNRRSAGRGPVRPSPWEPPPSNLVKNSP